MFYLLSKNKFHLSNRVSLEKYLRVFEIMTWVIKIYPYLVVIPFILFF